MGREPSRSPSRERKRVRSRSRERSLSPKRRRDRSVSRERRDERREDRYGRDRDRPGRHDDRRDHRDRDRGRADRRDDRRERRRSVSRERPARRSRSRDRAGAAGGDDLLPPPPALDGTAAQPDGAGANQQAQPKDKRQPLSLEELLRQRKIEQEEQQKPKFLSKAEREKLALERRQQAVASTRAVDGLNGNGAAAPSSSILSRRDMLLASSSLRDAPSLPPPPPHASSSRDHRDYRDRQAAPSGSSRGGSGAAAQTGKDARERERELELIKQQYLGAEKIKKKVLKPSEKYKFNFDWNADEDTSKDLNPLYAQTHEASLLFGRGMRAGIDRREQKKAAAVLEAEALRRARAAAGIADTQETRQQDRNRERLADRYDGADMRVEKHWTEKALEAMNERDWRIFREDFNISFKGSNVPNPLRKWEEAPLPKELLNAIERVGYKKPSPIQMAAIPLGMQGRDVIGVAETGSGKTAAFVLPMLAYIMKQPPMTEVNEADGPYSVVMAPTRELAQQIEEETLKLAHYTPYRVTAIVGGQSIEEQGNKLRKGCEIVIATPGRLVDCIERRYAVLNQCNYVVLDEADRMIDMGFEPQVMAVLDAMPSSNLKPENEDAALEEDKVYRTTYMFSATMPPQVERLARKYLRRPVVVNIGRAGKMAENVTQRVMMLKPNEKPNMLQLELDRVEEKKAIVFVNTKSNCDYVSGLLEEAGNRCAVLHGGKSQDQREAGIKGFRENVYNILIATDVAGRGIDVPDVALVINYDMPNNIESYTHRIGRTGRAGKKGVAVTFLTLSDTEVFYDLRKILEEAKVPVPHELARHEASRIKPGEGRGKRPDTVYLKD